MTGNQNNRVTLIVPRTDSKFKAETSLLKILGQTNDSSPLDKLFLDKETLEVLEVVRRYADQKEIPLIIKGYLLVAQELRQSNGNYAFILNKDLGVVEDICNELRNPGRKVEARIIY